IEGGAPRLALGVDPLEARVIHEILGALFHRHAARVEADPDLKPARSRERPPHDAELDLRVAVSVAVVEQGLLGVEPPTLREGARAHRLSNERRRVLEVEEVRVMPRIDLVNRDRRERPPAVTLEELLGALL